MLNYGKQTITSKDIKSVLKVLNSNYLTSGPYVEKFEKDLNKKFGGKYCCVVSNGTAALYMLGKALGWKRNDLIATTPISFIATTNCIVQNGAKPEFVDIDKKTYTIDPNKLEEILKKKKLKAVIAVDYAGHPCDWASLNFLSKKYNFTLINDACHSIGSKINNNIKYAIKYADFVTQSFHPVKAITTGEGGSLITNDKKIAEKVYLMRNHFMDKSKAKKPWIYEIHNPGMNYRISDLQCALGVSQLKLLDGFIKKRRQIAKIYYRELNDNKNFILPYQSKNIYHAFHLFPILVRFDKIKTNKMKMYNFFLKQGIKLQVHYIPIHLQPYYKKLIRVNRKLLEISENFYQNEFSLPIFPTLKKNQLFKVINQLKSLK